MKKLLIFTLTCMAFYANAQVQVKMNDLIIPDAPGLILGDKAPTMVSKPSTPRAFSASLMTLAEGGAIEVSPYWLSNKPNYTYNDFIDEKFPFLQTFTFSVATYKEKNTFGFAPGIRAQLLKLYSKRGHQNIQKKAGDLLSLLSQGTTINQDSITKANEALEEASQQGLFVVEFAAAVLGKSTEGYLKNLNFDKSGTWLNIKWQPAKFPVGLVGLASYSWKNHTSSQDSSAMDFGAGLKFAKAKWDLSAEYVNRRETGGKHYDRLAFAVNYAINENIVLVGSVGKDLSGVNNIISLLGFKVGLSRNVAKNQ
ncbi:hypothetical protein [Pedobacter kyonggii]|uniref:Uncharacterized protein n=1 Tax=Pedobacter kyonggii TaxID=1926871 RepID=A0A4Q9HGA1_9SPHI|nr:hypothetical protein [Pedobacter kyonggii]TBO44264.1 hypothetical protein EYS08_02845 [Pedobacter kyonggii]